MSYCLIILKKIIFATFIAILFAGCSNPSMNSIWRTTEIKIDGSKIDWQGFLKYFEDEKVAIGIANDNENLYFCLATSDNSKIMKILRTGFTVWIVPENNTDKTIGIQYPIKREMVQMSDALGRGDMGKVNGDEKQKQMIDRFIIQQDEILIVNYDKFPLNAYPLENEVGLEARINYEMHQLVYELKVPLANNKLNKVFADVLPNQRVKIGFESGEFERPEQGDHDPSGMGAADRDGGVLSGSMRGGGRGGNRSGNRPNMSNLQDLMKPIEFWMEVKLAAGNL